MSNNQRTTVRQLLKNWASVPKYADKRAGGKIRYKSFVNQDPTHILHILEDRLKRHGIKATVQKGKCVYAFHQNWVAITV